MARFKDTDWSVAEFPGNPGSALNCHEATLAVLMDIRDELKQIKRRLEMGPTWDSYMMREMRGLRRDVKNSKRCHRAHRAENKARRG